MGWLLRTTSTTSLLRLPRRTCSGASQQLAMTLAAASATLLMDEGSSETRRAGVSPRNTSPLGASGDCGERRRQRHSF